MESGADEWWQLDITDDGFLSLMTDGGETKDDVKVPEGEVGDKINKLFTEDQKDTSKPPSITKVFAVMLISAQTSLFSPPWVRRPPSTPRRLQRARLLRLTASAKLVDLKSECPVWK